MSLDHVRGVIYGQAIGDALGLPAEFKSASAINTLWPDPKWPTSYQDTMRTQYGWKAGEWSDDTEQALCILDAYLKGVDEGRDPNDLPDLLIVADEFVKWAQTNGRGMGNHTWLCLQNTLFLLEPHAVSEEVWESSNRQAAPNGAVMRTSYVGVLHPYDLAWTAEAAAEVAKTTHFDPRCVASAVAVSVAIAALVNGHDTRTALDLAEAHARPIEPGCVPFIQTLSLEEIKLDEGMGGAGKRAPIGYTYKCLGAAFWALREAQSRMDKFVAKEFGMHEAVRPTIFHDVLRQVIRAGGDTDTNGAVAGAILGALFGASGIPAALIEGLVPKSALDARIDRLIEHLES